MNEMGWTNNKVFMHNSIHMALFVSVRNSACVVEKTYSGLIQHAGEGSRRDKISKHVTLAYHFE